MVNMAEHRHLTISNKVVHNTLLTKITHNTPEKNNMLVDCKLLKSTTFPQERVNELCVCVMQSIYTPTIMPSCEKYRPTDMAWHVSSKHQTPAPSQYGKEKSERGMKYS